MAAFQMARMPQCMATAITAMTVAFFVVTIPKMTIFRLFGMAEKSRTPPTMNGVMDDEQSLYQHHL